MKYRIRSILYHCNIYGNRLRDYNDSTGNIDTDINKMIVYRFVKRESITSTTIEHLHWENETNTNCRHF